MIEALGHVGVLDAVAVAVLGAVALGLFLADRRRP